MEFHELPNIKHIDRICKSVVSYPRKWVEAFDIVSETMLASTDKVEQWYCANDLVTDQIMLSKRLRCLQTFHIEIKNAFKEVNLNFFLGNSARDAGMAAISMLVAYDDCSHLLDSTPNELRVLFALGDDRALMMLPAAYVFSQRNMS